MSTPTPTYVILVVAVLLVVVAAAAWLLPGRAPEPFDCPSDSPHKGWGLNADKCCKTKVNKFCHPPKK